MNICPDQSLLLLGRLSLALLLGGIIGLEREHRRKPAGLRTHMLVSLGAALFVLVPLSFNCTAPSAEALSRALQGVATGVGFLGAGEILHGNREAGLNRIHGLTSAASLWISAALGVAAGTGQWRLGVIAVVLVLWVLVGVRRLERGVRDRSKTDDGDSQEGDAQNRE
ncbi:MAG: MgtC/SapB family protein [Synechococcales cyanobacterium CRU_2_2]|nr:MgtC/SapB family protein [Synechococcales cyanobacterium CRU_2_2]